MKKKTKQKPNYTKAIIKDVIILACSIATLVLSFINMSNIMASEGEVSDQIRWYSVAIFFLIGGLHLPFFFKSTRASGSIKHIIYAICYGSCGVLILTIGAYKWTYMIVAIISFLTLISGRIISIFHNKEARNILINSLSLLILVTILVTAIIYTFNGDYTFPLLLCQATIAALSFIYILQEAFSKIQFNELREIVKKTYAFEILLGLLSLIISFSFLFTFFEEITYGDALWYCFAVVTTIGFGDITVTHIVCRILSVILGLYGVLVVAVLTSIVVNLYNATKHSNKEKEEKDSIL